MSMPKFLLTTLCFSCFLLNGCLSSLNYGRLADAGMNAAQGVMLNEEEARQTAMRMRQQMDATSKVVPEKSKYTKRLRQIMAKETNVNGIPLNYKVYMTPEMNANATPDGSIRVNSGLMDKLNDDELRFVLGHEIGHVAKGHSFNKMRMAYATAAAKAGIGAINSTAAALADSTLGEIAQNFINAQFSQSQELEADKYGMEFLKTNKYNTSAAMSAMRKLGLSGGGFLASHPSGEKRLKKLEALERGEDTVDK